MPVAADLSTKIQTAAESGVQSVTVDGQTTVAMSVQDQIAADRYLASKATVKNRTRGFRMAKLVPPAAG